MPTAIAPIRAATATACPRRPPSILTATAPSTGSMPATCTAKCGHSTSAAPRRPTGDRLMAPARPIHPCSQRVPRPPCTASQPAADHLKTGGRQAPVHSQHHHAAEPDGVFRYRAVSDGDGQSVRGQSELLRDLGLRDRRRSTPTSSRPRPLRMTQRVVSKSARLRTTRSTTRRRRAGKYRCRHRRNAWSPIPPHLVTWCSSTP